MKTDQREIDNKLITFKCDRDEYYPDDKDTIEVEIHSVYCLLNHREIYHILDLIEIQEIENKLINKLCTN